MTNLDLPGLITAVAALITSITLLWSNQKNAPKRAKKARPHGRRAPT